MKRQGMRRRTFLKGMAAGAAAVSFPAIGRAGTPANNRVNLACIGLGNQGGSIARSIGSIEGVNVVALCDVDLEHERASATINAFPEAKRFQDFRKLFEEMGDQIDAVTVGTPDHSHFPIAMLAMSMGKHVYIEKPLAHSFLQCELMMAAEKKYNVAAQMGNQGHSGNNYFQFKAWTEAGVIKDVTRVDAFMNSPRRWHGWTVDGFPEEQPKPETLDWDLWHAGAEPVAFNERLHPQNWRSWYRFGNGAFGDWGPHILDTIHRFLELGLPSEIEAVKREGPNDYIYPQATTIRFGFPARSNHPACDIFWYDGTQNRPEKPAELEDRDLQANGKLIYSKDLVFYGGTHGSALQIVPEAKRREMYDDLPKDSARGQSNHHLNFIRACRGEEQCRSSLDVAAPLSQMFSLGVLAQRLGGKLIFDRETKQITNNSKANALLAGDPPRKGWEQYYKL